MFDWLLHVDLYISIPLIIIFSVGITVGSLVIIRKKFHYEGIKKNHEVTSFIFNGYGLIYAVLVAFVVFAVWAEYEDAKKVVTKEAIVSIELFLDIKSLDDSLVNQVRRYIIEYDSIVAYKEWSELTLKTSSNEARDKISQIFIALGKYNPSSESQKIVLDECYDRLNELVEQRRMRVFHSQNRIPDIIWVVLIIGAMLSVFFTYFFYLESFLVHCLLTGVFTLMNCLILFLIFVLDNSFVGASGISNHTFIYILDILNKFVNTPGL